MISMWLGAYYNAGSKGTSPPTVYRSGGHNWRDGPFIPMLTTMQSWDEFQEKTTQEGSACSAGLGAWQEGMVAQPLASCG